MASGYAPTFPLGDIVTSNSQRRGCTDNERRTSRCERGHRESRGSGSRAHPADQRVGNFEIGIDVLHIVVLAERLDELEEFFALLVVDRDRILRPPYQRGLARFAELGFQHLGDRAEMILSGIDLVAVLT